MDNKKLNISFFLHKRRKDKDGKSPLFLRVTFDGNRESISTGLKLYEKSWNSQKSLVKGNSEEANAMNKLINSLKSRLLGIYADLMRLDKPISAEILKSKLLGLEKQNFGLLDAFLHHNQYLEKIEGNGISKGTIVKFKTLKTKVEQFVRHSYNRNDILLGELNTSFLVRFETYLKTVDSIGHNTAIKYIQFLKKILNYSIQNGWIESNPFSAFKCSFKVVNRQALTLEEVKKVESLELNNQRLDRVRDVFVFCCYTGLSYADIKNLTIDKVINGIDNNPWLETYRAKTKVRVPVPLLDAALVIINKYSDWRNENRTTYVLPILSNQKMNAYLKELGDLAGINKPLSCHIARHSFATIALTKGVPIESVSKMLGHTKVSTTQIYAKIVDAKLANDINALRDKMND